MARSKISWGIWGGGSSATSEKLCNFQHYLRMETVFPTTKLPQNYCINMNFASTSPSHIPCLKDNPQNRTTYESKETLKIPISKLCSELGKNWKYSVS